MVDGTRGRVHTHAPPRLGLPGEHTVLNDARATARQEAVVHRVPAVGLEWGLQHAGEGRGERYGVHLGGGFRIPAVGLGCSMQGRGGEGGMGS